jgi:hypothetical protein
MSDGESGTVVRSGAYNSLAGNDWLNDEKWPELDMKLCMRADQVCKENTLRAAMRFKFNALLSRGMTLEGTPHLDSMTEDVRREFCHKMAEFGKEGLYRIDKYGIIFWRWYDHPTFTKIPRHLDPETTKIKFLRSSGYRTIYHLYDLLPQMGSLAPGKPRLMENAFVYEVYPPDIHGRIDSMVISLIPYYEELIRVKQDTSLAQYQLARPVRIEETPEKTITDGSISNSSDEVALRNEVAQAQGIGGGGGVGGDGGDDGLVKMAAKVDPVAKYYVNSLNQMNSHEKQLLHNSDYMGNLKERKLLKEGRVELDPGKILVSNKMMKAEAPANVQEVEIAYSQRVYESLGIPRTMATSEGSKTSTNQNSQELFDQMRLECVNFLEHFITETYNTMFQIDNKYSYWTNKINQYHDMKRVAKHINKQQKRKQRGGGGSAPKRQRRNENYDEEEDSDWDEDINKKFDEMFAESCTQQEEYDCTNVKVLITGAKPVASITEWRAAGYLNGKGARELFLQTTKIPDEYVNDEATIDEFAKSGLQTEDESTNAMATKTEKAKAKKASTQGV